MKDKSQEKNESDLGPSSEEVNRLDAVRDLLFGPNDQEYRKEFQSLKEQIAESKNELEKSSSEIQGELSKRIDDLEKKILENIESLEKKVSELGQQKIDKNQLASLLKTVAQELES